MMIAIALACAGCIPLPAAVPLETACTVTDGDTIRCGDERIRLLGIDAPEKAGRCRQGRVCAPGDPVASTKTLERLLAKGPFSIVRLGRDRYGRTLALVRAGQVDLSCHQLASGNAVYKPKWDNKRAVHRTCPQLAPR